MRYCGGAVSGALPSARALQRDAHAAFPWGRLHQSPADSSLVLADQAYYEHHRHGSQRLARAISAYLGSR